MAPHSLMSLWDMLRFYAEKFVEISKNIEQIVVGLRLNAGKSAVLNENGGTIPFKLREIQTMCASLGLSMTAAGLERVSNLVKLEPPLSPELFENGLLDVRRRLEDELTSRYFLAVAPEDAHFMDADAPHLGAEVSAKFPSLAYDIAEAGKCVALGISTGVAFHSIRCLEAGFSALCRCIGVPNPVRGSERNWANRLRKVEDRMDLKWPPSTARMTGDGQFFDALFGSIRGMQNPYRNNTMHFDQKYDRDEAMHIFELVKGVMQKIASRMDENGQPPAP